MSTRWRGRAGLVLLAAPVVLIGVLGWARRWTADDAFINYRIVDQLLHGAGPVFNDGERVEAYTSPLWLALLAIGDPLVPFLDVEWVSVLLGLALAAFGVAAAGTGAAVLARGREKAEAVVPLGMLVFVALPPVWDFATSGLETGLTFAWIGATFWALAALERGARTAANGQDGEVSWRRLAAVAVLAGIGPLVRPDLALFSATFLAALLLVSPRRTLRDRLAIVAAAAALPVAYQVFRMGYFAALVPNTAIAKEAGEAYWSRGWDYLVDFVKPYALWLPLAALGGAYALDLLGDWRSGRREAVAVALAPVVAGLLNAVFVVRVGGDFMHARLLLPGLFGLLAPVAVPIGLRRASTVLGLLALGWALVCLAALRVEYPKLPALRVLDERAFYVGFSGKSNPVTLEDYAGTPSAADGRALARLARHDRALLLQPPSQSYFKERRYGPLPPAPSQATPVVAGFYAVGVAAYAAGRDVWVVDRLGITDPLASRVRFAPIATTFGTLPRRYRAGHEKLLPAEWIIAQFADLRARPRLIAAPGVAAARQALACDSLRRLTQAVRAPMTGRRFLRNLGSAWELNDLRIPADPVEARAKVCSPD